MSKTARRVTIAGAIVCAGALLTVADAPQPRSSALTSTALPAERIGEPPALKASNPASDAKDVSGRAPLTVWFTRPMAAASLNAQTVTLVGPAGGEPVNVASFGDKAIVQPISELLPASRYTLFINGATDQDQRPLPLSTIGFDTAAVPVQLAAAGPIIVDSPTSSSGTSGVSGSVPLPSAAAAATLVTDDSEPAALIPTVPLGAGEQFALAQADAVPDLGEWIPGPQQFTGRWRADRGDSPLQALPSLLAPTGITALSGQVLGMNGRAIPGVTLRVDGHEAHSDATGRFLIQGLAPGFAKLEIDGVTANHGTAFYGYYAARVELQPQQTTALPYTIWMPRLDPAGTVRISTPTTSETVVTSPRIPGLELHIPAGTVIRDRNGQIITELNLTAIPVDRPPFPVPDLGVPTYFTIQPGGAVLQSATSAPSQGARLFYPNFKHEVPGARGVFWNYDPDDREWFVYGQGTISKDANQAIPDPGVVIHELTGAMFDGGNSPPATSGGPPCAEGAEDCGDAADPVTLSTGQFDHVEQDAFLKDVLSISIERTYNSADVNQRAFGIGMTQAYDVFLFSQNQWQEVDVILGNGVRVHYVRISPGTDSASAVLESSAPGVWYNSVISRNLARSGWDLTFRNGVRWFFPQFQPLTEIADRNGNLLRIVRDGNNGTSGNVIHVESPNGRSVDFTYNAAGLVSSIVDNVGRTYSYNYDSAGRLTSVVDPQGGTRQYSWDTTNNRITDVRDPRNNLVVHNQYDSAGHVIHQDLADGSSYNLAYTLTTCIDNSCTPTIIFNAREN